MCVLEEFDILAFLVRISATIALYTDIQSNILVPVLLLHHPRSRTFYGYLLFIDGVVGEHISAHNQRYSASKNRTFTPLSFCVFHFNSRNINIFWHSLFPKRMIFDWFLYFLFLLLLLFVGIFFLGFDVTEKTPDDSG